LDLEEAMYADAVEVEHGLVLDWKRRLGMLLWSKDGSPVQSGDSTMSFLLSQYESDTANALAPPPFAWYLDVDDDSVFEKCILYRLIELFASNGDEANIISLADVIAPRGHTFHEHDVSKAFHFASALSALDVCQPLTQTQECQLLEAYAFQLVEANVWEWAVYVLLCTFRDVDCIDRGILQRKKSMAQDIVLRHYTTNDNNVDLISNQQGQQQQQRRSFLERDVGIPSSWFDMALSHRYRRTFDPHGFVQQTAQFSLLDALTTYEEIIPDIIINGDQMTDHKCVIEFLEVIKSETRNEWDISRLGGMVYEFLILSKNVNEVAIATTMDAQQDITVIEERIDELLLKAERLQTALYRAAVIATTTLSQRTSRFFGGMTTTSREMCLAELTSAVSAMVLHLNIFRMGGSPFEAPSTSHNNRQRLRKGGRKLKKTSELMYAWSNQARDVLSSSARLNLKGVLGSRTILRGTYGLA